MKKSYVLATIAFLGLMSCSGDETNDAKYILSLMKLVLNKRKKLGKRQTTKIIPLLFLVCHHHTDLKKIT